MSFDLSRFKKPPPKVVRTKEQIAEDIKRFAKEKDETYREFVRPISHMTHLKDLQRFAKQNNLVLMVAIGPEHISFSVKLTDNDKQYFTGGEIKI